MKALFLTRYGRMGASSRVRSYQYLPFLEPEGIEVTVHALLGDAYLAALYQDNRRSMAQVVRGLARRLYRVLTPHHFDVVWVEGEAFPWLPGVFEQALGHMGCPYIADYDDALFHVYNQSRQPLVKSMLAGKVSGIMRRAKVVTVGNEYLADYARKAGAQRVTVLPSVIDLTRYPATQRVIGPTVRVGWIGTPKTLPYLKQALAPIAIASRQTPLRLVTIGVPPIMVEDVAVESKKWTEESEVESLRDIDIGIMPLVPSPFAEGKCGYKLIQYMACGIPTVATPTRANAEIVDHGVTGFLVDNASEWTDALSLLARDPDLRSRMGSAGRAKVEREYCLQVTAPLLAEVLLDAPR